VGERVVAEGVDLVAAEHHAQEAADVLAQVVGVEEDARALGGRRRDGDVADLVEFAALMVCRLVVRILIVRILVGCGLLGRGFRLVRLVALAPRPGRLFDVRLGFPAGCHVASVPIGPSLTASR
jgi:hypothetical protein